ncbi:MAG: hypothetical protein ONA69_05195, partial [candidate division KSB1 bacterium]|nr:hypothetical protein [candidate division KSB1 bacterium]
MPDAKPVLPISRSSWQACCPIHKYAFHPKLEQQAADLLEEVQLSAERELAISTADTQAKALRAVRA